MSNEVFGLGLTQKFGGERNRFFARQKKTRKSENVSGGKHFSENSRQTLKGRIRRKDSLERETESCVDQILAKGEKRGKISLVKKKKKARCGKFFSPSSIFSVREATLDRLAVNVTDATVAPKKAAKFASSLF